MHELSWRWIALMLAVPPVAGILVAFPIWRTTQMILGNLAGSVVIFAAALGMIFRESAELDRLAQQCLDAGYVCFPEPSAFMRYAIYAFVALVEVIALFMWSLRVEAKMRNRRYDPEWR